MGASGTTTVNFGTFPGKSDASVAITGQTSISSGSIVGAWLVPTATSDHSADEHLADAPQIFAGNVVAGTGFTIYAVAQPAAAVVDDITQDYKGIRARRSTNSPRVYGQWTVAWAWV